MSGTEASVALLRLMHDASGIKNRLIDWCLRQNWLDELRGMLPPGFLYSRVASARCLIRPATPEIALSLENFGHADNQRNTAAILECIGHTLNIHEPDIN